MSDLPPPPAPPIRGLQGLVRLLEALDSAAAATLSSSLPRGYFGPPATFGRQQPHRILNRDRPGQAPQVTVYDLSAIPPQDRGFEVALLIASHLSNPLINRPRRSNARRSNAQRLRRRQSTRNLRGEPWTLEGLGLGRRAIWNNAGLRTESQHLLHNRVADIMDAAAADVEVGRGADPVVSMRHWDDGRR